MRAHISKNTGYLAGTIIFASLTLWALIHITRIVSDTYNYGSNGLHWAYLFTFVFLFVSIVIAHREKPIEKKYKNKDKEYVTVIIPAYNEDPKLLRDCLRSLIYQSRKPNKIFLVDDGSNDSDYTAVKRWFIRAAKNKKVEVRWVRKENGGKRSAQALAVKRTRKSTIYVTVDSDSVLDHVAIEEGLKPFDDSKVMSVAGVVLSLNNQTNLLARFTDLMFVTGQLVDRSMMSALGSVLVNSGGLAFYRSHIVRDNLKEYMNEKFFGQRIEFSDDSMLTLYSLMAGKTVQQPSAVVFTMMPDKLSHHIRQQVRWMRGSFIRSWWRIKFLPILSYGFIRQAMGWVQFAITSVVFMIVFVIHPATNSIAILPVLLLVPIIIGYLQALRYLTYRRSDQSFKSQFATFLLSPIASIWSFTVFRVLKIYAMITCLNAGWGTRSSVEVSLD